jgi:hypothetical protein
MKKLTAAAIALSLCGGDRLKVADDSDIKLCVIEAAEAVNDENMDRLLGQCVRSAQKEVRARMAPAFAMGDVQLDLLGCEVVSKTTTRAKILARYAMGHRIVVSDISVRKENGYWKISEERTRQEEMPGLLPTCTAHRGAFYASSFFSQ